MSYIIKNTAALINTKLTDSARKKISQGKFDISYFQIGDSEVCYNCVNNFDPVNFYYKAVNNSGADYKWTLDDIPEFWKSRITKKIESFSVISISVGISVKKSIISFTLISLSNTSISTKSTAVSVFK